MEGLVRFGVTVMNTLIEASILDSYVYLYWKRKHANIMAYYKADFGITPLCTILSFN